MPVHGRLRQAIAATAAVLRYARAVSHWLLAKDPRAVARNHGVRIGDQAVKATRGYADTKYTSPADGVDIRSWTAKANATQVVREIGGRRIIRVDCEYRDPNVSIFLDGRAWHAQSLEKVLDDMEVRNRLEARGECVLEYGYGDVMDDFDRVADEVREALDGRGDRATVDIGALPGLHPIEVDERTGQATMRIDVAGWLASEGARRTALANANRARLAGWRLRRVP
ncbi:MAG: hypothetical protein ACRD2W_11885 [Acidimicrobiales bacterium]